jgi:probable S-adenosylmethionine-dependent methyltransferase, YraL family
MTESMEDRKELIPPGIYLVGTPIGNMEDITFRALRVLKHADVLACEDTRITRKLFSRFGLSAPSAIYSCNDHNERRVASKLAELAAEGKVVVYCSDAGMPGISDPGYLIAQAALGAGVLLDVIPGPSAIPTGLALSGLASGTFTFLGFPPRRDGRLAAILAEHGMLRPTMVFYESPHRLGRLFRLAAEGIDPGRQAAACLELTKKFQRVIRGSLGELAEKFSEAETRGEATVIIEGAGKRQDSEEEA